MRIAPLMLVLCAATVRADDKERFLTEAPTAWEEYYAFARQLQGKAVRHTQGTKGETIETITGESKRNEHCGFFHYNHNRELSVEEELYAFNRAYTFRLNRKNGKWIIASVAKREEGRVNQDTATTTEALRSAALLSLADSTDLPDLLRQPNFQVRKAESVTRNGVRLVRVEFENPHQVTEPPFCPLQSGVLFLEPERFWCLHSGEIVKKGTNADVKQRFEFESDGAEYPIPRRLVETNELTYLDNGDKSTWTSTVTFELQVPVALPTDSEFTLPAFGLPEPPWLRERPKPTRWWLWGALAGGVILVLGVAIWWKKR